MRTRFCPACAAKKNGVKSRKAFPHIGCRFDQSINQQIHISVSPNGNEQIVTEILKSINAVTNEGRIQ